MALDKIAQVAPVQDDAWVMVPREPTSEMQMVAFPEMKDNAERVAHPYGVYKAMIAAAPALTAAFPAQTVGDRDKVFSLSEISASLCGKCAAGSPFVEAEGWAPNMFHDWQENGHSVGRTRCNAFDTIRLLRTNPQPDSAATQKDTL